MKFPRKNSVLDNLPLCPPAHPPPEKRKFYFYCRLAFSDTRLPFFKILPKLEMLQKQAFLKGEVRICCQNRDMNRHNVRRCRTALDRGLMLVLALSFLSLVFFCLDFPWFMHGKEFPW